MNCPVSESPRIEGTGRLTSQLARELGHLWKARGDEPPLEAEPSEPAKTSKEPRCPKRARPPSLLDSDWDPCLCVHGGGARQLQETLSLFSGCP
mmetsp:Transcript_13493/g.31953  ORF Transcript_13493/g.31953 Transcript_13493/m.31953 type:complete len:94 (-) Transcript_13493:654-935(-)